MKVKTKIRVDDPPAQRGTSRFLLRFPVPTNQKELALDWTVDGAWVQRDILDRNADGSPRTVVCSVMALHGAAHELEMSAGHGTTRRHLTPPENLGEILLTLGAKGSERFKCRPFDGEETFRYVRESGPLVRTEAHWSRFRRASDGKELLGVWSFVTYRANGVLSVKFNISNACGKATRDGIVGANGPVYFSGIYLEAPSGEAWISDHERPSIKPRQNWLVAPLEDGSDHSIYPREHFYRRVAFFSDGSGNGRAMAEESLAFNGTGVAEGPASYYERGHGATQTPLPEISTTYRSDGGAGIAAARHEAGKNLSELRSILYGGRAGSQMMETEALGWAHPIGSPSAYMPGGWWVFPTAAPFQTVEETRLVSLCMDLHAEREPIWALDAETGHPLGQEDFGREGPMNFLIADTAAMRNIEIPGWKTKRFDPWSSGDCPYREALSAYLPEDAQHGVRNTTMATALFYATGDASAEFHLRAWAEHHILARTNKAHTSWGWHKTKLVTNFERLPWVKANPHHGGVTGGRDTAWTSLNAATYYAIAPEAWRQKLDHWFLDESAVIVLGTMSNGVGTYDDPHVKRTALERPGSTLVEADGVHQSFEIGLAALGAMALIVNVWRGRQARGAEIGMHDGLASVIVKSALFLHSSQLNSQGIQEGATNLSGAEAPPWYVNVYDRNKGEPVNGRATRWAGGGEGLHGHFHLLYAFLLDNENPIHLQRAYNLLGGPGPRGENVPVELAVREGAWYADRVLVESSWGRPLVLHHAAGLVATMQNKWRELLAGKK